MQLAAYRLGWSRLTGVPVEQVSAGFHHVAAGVTLRPVDLLDEAGLLALVTGTGRRPGMSGERDLGRLLAGLDPVLADEPVRRSSLGRDRACRPMCGPFATVDEDEGLTRRRHPARRRPAGASRTTTSPRASRCACTPTPRPSA